jgi:4-hydroxy-tetrahydrodipicolinate reductase
MTLFIQGASGKLGRLILEDLRQQGLSAVAISQDRSKGQSGAGSGDRYAAFAEQLRQHAAAGAGVLDVSLAEGSEALCHFLLAAHSSGARLPAFVIIGTTGHSSAQSRLMEQLAQHTAMVLAPNFSRGVLLLQEMLGFDLGLIELHHTLKKDAPSGTALALAKTAGIDTTKISSLRVGHVIGEHTLALSGNAEEIRITHQAGSRHLFAAGAVDLAQRLLKKPLPAGLYAMADVLGRSDASSKETAARIN